MLKFYNDVIKAPLKLSKTTNKDQKNVIGCHDNHGDDVFGVPGRDVAQQNIIHDVIEQKKRREKEKARQQQKKSKFKLMTSKAKSYDVTKDVNGDKKNKKQGKPDKKGLCVQKYI